MGFFSSMVPNYHDNHYATPNSFMTCIVKVDTQSHWQKTVSKVLKKCQGVKGFRMDQSGMVEISGIVDPNVVLRMLERAGRSAELTWFQFGECSSNLFMPTTNTNSYYPSRDGRYLQPPGNLSRPSPYTNQTQVYNPHNTFYDYGYGYNQSAGYNGYNSYGGANQYLDYDNDNCIVTHQSSAYTNGGRQIQHRGGGDGEDIACCIIM